MASRTRPSSITQHRYGFKAVQSQQGGGAPLVWFQTQKYSATTKVQWEVQYQAYASRDQIIPHGQVTASDAKNINLGQSVDVTSGGILDTPKSSPPDTAISLINVTQEPYTGGISVVQDGAAKPICAFPLYGQQMDVIAPIEKVLLMFSTTPINTGTVIEQAYSSGIFVDLTAQNQRSVSFDVNKGWDWGGFGWAKAVLPNEQLVPLLIDSNPSSAGTPVKRRSLTAA